MAELDMCSPSADSTKSQYIVYYTHEFKKTDSIHNEILNGAKYVFRSMNDSVSFPMRLLEEDDRYIIPTQSKNSMMNEMIEWLPSSLKQDILSISDYNSYMDYANSHEYGWGDSCPKLTKARSNFSTYLHLTIPVQFKETKAPAGYQKKDYLTWADATILFNFDENDRVFSREMVLDFAPDFDLFEIDSSINYMDYVTSEYSFLDYIYDNGILSSTECGGHYQDEVMEVRDMKKEISCYNRYPVIEDEVGEVHLKIDQTIQNTHDITVSHDGVLNSEIVVSNVGNASSGNNIIQTVLPKNIEVDTLSITDQGVYDKASRTITWNIDLLDSLGEEKLNFNIYVDDDHLGTYKLNSTISSDQEELITSKDVLLHIFDNPKTSSFSILFFLFLFIIFLLSFLYKKFLLKYFK